MTIYKKLRVHNRLSEERTLVAHSHSPHWALSLPGKKFYMMPTYSWERWKNKEQPNSPGWSLQSKLIAYLQSRDIWPLSDLGVLQDPEPANGRGSLHIRPGLESKCQLGKCRKTRAREGTCLCHGVKVVFSNQNRPRGSCRGTCLQSLRKNETSKANKMTTSHCSQLCNSDIVSKFICAINNLGTFSPEIWKCQHSWKKEKQHWAVPNKGTC